MEYIEREAIIASLRESYDALKNIYDGLKHEEERAICRGQLATFIEAILRIKDAPAVDVAHVVHGKPNFVRADKPWPYYGTCNVCGAYVQA